MQIGKSSPEALTAPQQRNSNGFDFSSEYQEVDSTSEFRLDGPSMAPPGRFGYPFDFDRLTAFGNLSVSTRYRLKQKVLDLSWCRETVTSRFREVPVFGNLSVSRGYRSSESSQFREVPVSVTSRFREVTAPGEGTFVRFREMVGGCFGGGFSGLAILSSFIWSS